MPQSQRVLLIDHSDTALAIITKLINKYISGVEVDIANSAEAAFNQLKHKQYNLITMSRNLPGIECQHMVEKIRRELNVRSTPLIVVSGENLGVFEEQLACQYVNGYFDKKLGQKKLVLYIQSFLSIKAPSACISGNILYVEDSPTVAQVVKNFLTRNGHNYLLAQDAESALLHIRHSFSKDHVQPFDLLLTDIQLKGYMSGRDLIREVRHGLNLGHKQLPILVTTSSRYNENPSALNRIFTAGANDVLEKPVNEALLIARINTLLTLRQQYMRLNQQELI
jgi:two-component system cell cycle response regulator